ncbi:MAG TPA: cellulase family glycosylhydrolase [Ktedonosporobacter sp.]|nr:cellulase family glycosylhydrolase [Ktedonosporobacter sp.]
MSKNVLSIRGAQIIDAEGQAVTLRGCGLGGWMNMENFITGYPANEEAQRQAVHRVLGDDKYEFFFDRFLEYFFGRDDAQFLASLSFNLLRLPVNYRHFESDMEPFVIKEEGFRHLDRVIELCAQQQIYTIIDLHALPGYQNQDWHSDNSTHKALFWKHKHFQDRVVHLWEVIADRYKGHPWVAGYNPINEPGDVEEETIVPFYQRLYQAIRAIDPDHILFLEGNRYSTEFHMFTEVWPDTIYTVHDYALPGFIDGGPYPGISRGEYVDRAVLEETFLQRTAYMRQTGTPIWVGEFGPVYVGEAAADAMRYQVLRDQLEIYNRNQANWAIWTYKDIGLQGIVSSSSDSPWNRLLQPVLGKKARLGVDTWGTVDTQIRHVMQPIEATFAKEFPDYNPFPFGVQWMINRLVRHILLAEPLLAEFGALFKGMSEQDIDTLMQSFQFKHCVQRSELIKILSTSRQ